MAGTRVLKPKHILWDKDRVRFKERCFTKAVEIRYSDMIAAYMVVSDRKTGGERRLPVLEVSDDLPGYAVIYDRNRSAYEIRCEDTVLTAGEFLVYLSRHSASVYIGYDDWVASMLDEKHFKELVHMVSVMTEN